MSCSNCSFNKTNSNPFYSNLDSKYYPREECGIVGLYNVPEASTYAYLGIYSLQHRGQESAGIAATDSDHLYRFTGMGKVADVFTEQKLKELTGNVAIAHNRYSTTGASYIRNAQPIRVESKFGSMALAHNGNLTNYWTLRQHLEKQGSIFLSTVDTEVISHLIARSKQTNLTSAIIEAMSFVKGAYSLLIMTKESLFVIRDPHGFRPLVMGKKGDGWVFSSETCSFDIMDSDYIRDVKPGEFIEVNKNGLTSSFPFQRKQESLCIFEYIYFARPDSIIFNESVYDVRFRLGKVLAKETAVEADLVMPVPDSSTVAALGYAQEAGLPFHTGLIRSHYIGRTFIEPDQKIRDFGAKLKYNAIRSVVEGKRIIIVDDSIMRGTTQRKIIKMLRANNAKEIHVRISSAPTKHPCYYGIDIPTSSELIAATHTLEEIEKYIRVDSLRYMTEEGMIRAAKGGQNYCTACFNGNYPLPLDEGENYSNQKQLFEEYAIEEPK